MENMTIEDFINFILDVSDERIFEEEKSGNSKICFLHGYCYEFAIVLQHFISNSFIVINNANDHCAIRYQGRIYDASGDITETFRGRIAEQSDISHMEDRFKKKCIGGIRISEILIKEIYQINKDHGIFNKLPFYKKEKSQTVKSRS